MRRFLTAPRLGAERVRILRDDLAAQDRTLKEVGKLPRGDDELFNIVQKRVRDLADKKRMLSLLEQEEALHENIKRAKDEGLITVDVVVVPLVQQPLPPAPVTMPLRKAISPPPAPAPTSAPGKKPVLKSVPFRGPDGRGVIAMKKREDTAAVVEEEEDNEEEETDKSDNPGVTFHEDDQKGGFGVIRFGGQLYTPFAELVARGIVQCGSGTVCLDCARGTERMHKLRNLFAKDELKKITGVPKVIRDKICKTSAVFFVTPDAAKTWLKNQKVVDELTLRAKARAAVCPHMPKQQQK